MKPLLTKFRWFLMVSISLIAIFAVVALSAMRLALPYITDYGQTIEQKLSEELGQKVQIGKLDSDWEWFSPRLRVSDVYIYKKNQKNVLVHFDDVYFSFSLWRNLINLNLEPGEITLVGTHLNVWRTKDNQWQIQGYTLAGNGSADNGLVKKLLLNRRYSLFDSVIELKDEQRDNALYAFNVKRLVLESHGDELGLAVDSSLPAVLGKDINVVVKAKYLDNWKDWSGRLYLDGNELNLPRLLSYFEYKNIDLAGKADLEVWLDFEKDKLSSLTGKVRSSDLTVSKLNQSTRKTLNWQAKNLTTEFLLEKRNNVWQLVLDKLSMQVADHQWINAHLDFYINQESRSLGIKTDYLDLSDVDNLLLQFDIGDLSQQFKKISPVGNLHNTEIIVQDWAVLDHWYIKSRFTRLGGRLPDKGLRVDGLDGDILLSKNKGYISLDSRQIKLNWDQIKTPLNLKNFKTNIAIEKTQDGIVLRSQEFVSELDKVDLNARFELMFFDQVFIDMQWQTGKTTSDWAKKYMPDAVLGTTVATWLRESILAAETDSINVLYHGLVSDFPFVKYQGVSQVMLDISKGTLKYLPAWPEIKNIEARFIYENDHIRIDRSSGVTVNSQITDTITDINLLGEPHVIVNGHVVSDSVKLDKFFTATPLVDSYRQFTKGLSIGGNASCNLKLDIPLRTNAKVDVQGDVKLLGDRLVLEDLDYRISDIQGLLSFKNQMINADKLTGKMSGKTLQANISTAKYNDRLATRIVAEMTAGLDAVIPGQLDFQKHYLGDAAWQLDLFLHHVAEKNKPSLDLKLNGDFSAVALLLPEPLAKKPEQKTRLEFELKKIEDNFFIAADYNRQLLADISWSASAGVSTEGIRGQINLLTPLQKDRPEGLSVNANLKTLDINEWKNILLAYAPANDNGSRLINRISIKSDNVSYDQFQLKSLSLDARRKENYWKLQLDSDAIKGNGLIPANWSDNAPLNVSFDKLDLGFLKTDTETSPDTTGVPAEKTSKPSISPLSIPPLTISAKNVRFKDYNFEQVNLETSRDKRYGMTVHLLEAYGPELVIQSNGKWTVNNKGESQSSFRFELSSDDIGRMLSEYRITESLKKGDGKAVIEWSWPSEPYDFSWESVTGQLQVKVEDGRFKDVDPGAGRLLGMFSLSALPQRFMLDFSDTFSKGFEFDKLVSNANFANGHLYTSKTEINGTAADIYFSGRVGLVAKDYDQVMSVVPRISSGVSGWLAVLQGAAVGLTAYIGQKILGIDEAAKDIYHISGPWSDPNIVKLSKAANKPKVDVAE